MDRSEWVRVPRVPTGEMIQAAHEESHCGNGSEHMREVYAAMLSAAPPPPAEQASGELVALADEWRKAATEIKGNVGAVTAFVLCAENLEAALSQRPVADEAMRKVAAIAHSGGLLNMSEADALTAIRRLSLPFWAKEEKPEQVRSTLAPQQPTGEEE